MPEAQRLKSTYIERCIGCHCCSLACARQIHSKLSWETAGIRIISAGGLSSGFEAIICMACDDPCCAKVCPTAALSPRKGGGIKLNRKLCIGCTNCVKACCVGAIAFKPGDKYPYVCIHCGKCVPFCPHGCIELV